jgi:hypothetical protein
VRKSRQGKRQDFRSKTIFGESDRNLQGSKAK